MAILNVDIPRLQKLLEVFNVKEDFNVFACIVTGRSWKAINEGIVQVKYSNTEGSGIRSEAPKYLRQISKVLNSIPREMLLLLKTNDCLRGIEISLDTRSSSSPFIHMSKCCVQTISAYERELFYKSYSARLNATQDEAEKIGLYFTFLQFSFLSGFKEFIDLAKIYALQVFLAFFNF
jgi:aarF domain-containing kinase